jgi:hypothetical protein
MNESIEEYIPNWAEEFAAIVDIEYLPLEHNVMVRMALNTMMYEIADNFRNGEFREEILKQFGDQHAQ